jgi:hypothetical protein
MAHRHTESKHTEKRGRKKEAAAPTRRWTGHSLRGTTAPHSGGGGGARGKERATAQHGRERGLGTRAHGTRTTTGALQTKGAADQLSHHKRFSANNRGKRAENDDCPEGFWVDTRCNAGGPHTRAHIRPPARERTERGGAGRTECQRAE